MYSVVIPVFNSVDIIEKTVNGVRSYFLSSKNNFEIILVNDGSKDNSWEVIERLANQYDELISINLVKNYGQHNANMCGFRHASGDYLITMDDDLQNPPEEIAKLIEKANEGYDIVIGCFETKKHSFVRRLGSKLVGCINRSAFEIQKDLILSNFRIIRKDVYSRVCEDNSVTPYIPGLLLKFSGNPANVLVTHKERAQGQSNYTLRSLISLVANLLFSHTTIPLRCVAIFGFIISGVSFSLGIFYFIKTLITGSEVAGWATLVVLLSFFNGILVLILSVLGEYQVRILREISSNKSYQIDKVIR